MKINLLMLAAASAALTISACSKSEAPATEAEVAPVPQSAETAAPAAEADGLSPDAKAFLATLTPDELAKAHLSCVEAIRTAKDNSHIFDASLAAELKGVDYINRTELLSTPPLNALTIEQARAIMDMAPKFTAQSKPTADEVTGVRQCVMLVQNYAAAKAAVG